MFLALREELRKLTLASRLLSQTRHAILSGGVVISYCLVTNSLYHMTIFGDFMYIVSFFVSNLRKKIYDFSRY
jgi:hypothetical protein